MEGQADRQARTKAGRWVHRFNRFLVLIGGAISSVSMVVIGAILLVSVTLRYVFDSSLGFATELPTYLFPWLVAGGVIAAAGAGEHLAVDLLILRLPTRTRTVVVTIMWALVIAVFIYATMASFRLVDAFTGESTAILGWPVLGSYIAFPITLIALTVHAVGQLIATTVGVETSSNSGIGEATIQEIGQ